MEVENPLLVQESRLPRDHAIHFYVMCSSEGMPTDWQNMPVASGTWIVSDHACDAAEAVAVDVKEEKLTNAEDSLDVDLKHHGLVQTVSCTSRSERKHQEMIILVMFRTL